MRRRKEKKTQSEIAGNEWDGCEVLVLVAPGQTQQLGANWLL